MSPLIAWIAGFVYFSASFLLFVLNALLLFVICRRKEYRGRTYLIIRHICAVCMMQLAVFMVSGLMTILQSDFSVFVDRVCGAIIQSGWFFYIGLSVALAVDRLTAFGLAYSKLGHLASLALLIGSWLLWLCFLLLLLLPGFGMTYKSDIGFYRWNYNNDTEADILMAVEKYVDFSAYGIVFLIYTVGFFCFFKIRSSSGLATQSHWIHVEFRIFLVAATSFVYEMTFDVFWFWGGEFVSNEFLAAFLPNFLWIIDCGLFASLTFLISKSIRHKLLLSLFQRQHVKVVVFTSQHQHRS